MIRNHFNFFILLICTIIFVLGLYLKEFLKGPGHEQLQKEWFSYSSEKLGGFISELIENSDRKYYPQLIDNSSNTTLIYMENGKGNTYHGNTDRNGRWWIQHGPSVNGLLKNHIVFKQKSTYKLKNGYFFYDVSEFFEKNSNEKTDFKQRS